MDMVSVMVRVIGARYRSSASFYLFGLSCTVRARNNVIFDELAA